MNISPAAGKPASPSMLINVQDLVTAALASEPDDGGSAPPQALADRERKQAALLDPMILRNPASTTDRTP
ncbi:MAG: hypothetical protein H0X38_04540 [Planctomycetes bacterium]|nr:hypothetical protein [Planctomycetota bacterium]